MELSPAVYEEITGTSALPPIPGEDSDRRKYRRMPFGFRATILPTRKGVEGPASVVMVRDISLAGISLLNEDALKNGTSFVVEFRGGQDRPVKIRCATVRCEQGGMGGTQYVIGATFEELLTKELPPLPKEEPLPPLSDQSHIRGRLIKPNSEFPKHPATEADAILDASHPDPAPSGPFSMVKEDPIEPLSDQVHIFGKLIRPNSEMKAAPTLPPTISLVKEEPAQPPINQPRFESRPVNSEAEMETKAAPAEEPSDPQRDQTRILGRLTKSDPQPEKKPAPALSKIEGSKIESPKIEASKVEATKVETPKAESPKAAAAAAPAKDSSLPEALDEEAALAMLLAEPDEELDAISLQDFAIEEAGEELAEDTSILEELAKSLAESEKKPAAEVNPPAPEVKSTTPEAKAASPEVKAATTETKPATPEVKVAAPEMKPVAPEAKPAAPEIKVVALEPTKVEAEKKPTPVPAAPAVQVAQPEPVAKTTPKTEAAVTPADKTQVLGRLAKDAVEADKKPAPAPATPAAKATQSEPIAKTAPKVEPVTHSSDQVSILGRLTKADGEPEKKPTPAPVVSAPVTAAPIAAAPVTAAPIAAPPVAQIKQPEPAAKTAPKIELITAPTDQIHILVQQAKPTAEAEKKPAPAQAAPIAQKAESEPVAKTAPKAEPITPPSDSAKLTETKKNPRPETRHIPVAVASEDAAAKPAHAKAQPAAPTAPAAPSWSNVSKPSVQAEQKPIPSLRSPAKGVTEMSLAHTESTSEPTVAKNDVVTGVKALLMQQREQIKKQDIEMQALRTELAQAKRRVQQLQAKADADAKAMSELEAFLSKETGEIGTDTTESVAA